MATLTATKIDTEHDQLLKLYTTRSNICQNWSRFKRELFCLGASDEETRLHENQFITQISIIDKHIETLHHTCLKERK